jgi:hypothetical protein
VTYFPLHTYNGGLHEWLQRWRPSYRSSSLRVHWAITRKGCDNSQSKFPLFDLLQCPLRPGSASEKPTLFLPFLYYETPTNWNVVQFEFKVLRNLQQSGIFLTISYYCSMIYNVAGFKIRVLKQAIARCAGFNSIWNLNDTKLCVFGMFLAISCVK